MKRSLFVGAAAALAALAIPATASAQGTGYGSYTPKNTVCDASAAMTRWQAVSPAHCRRLIGGAIGNNVDTGDDIPSRTPKPSRLRSWPSSRIQPRLSPR